ncbi:MAG: NFACT RNA binding domain-containing protein [Clostridia bacterium]|nr:NFACT RNA binding domain-containing protein [Clostridia bacterium]
MALDGIFLRHIKNEIEQQALLARVSQIYQPNRDELVFVLRTFGGSKKLLLSSRANSPRLNFCEKTPENPAQPPMFCMLLRKRIGGGKLVSVRQAGCDRILFLDFECINELGDTEILTVICEIMGMYSNIIVADNKSGVIIDSLKRVDLTMSSQRLVLPNLKYELPAPQDKLNILDSSPQEITEKIKSLECEMPLNKALLRVIQGVSPIICRELEYRVCEGVSNRVEGVLEDKLNVELANLKDLTEDCSGKPCIVYREDGRPLDTAFMPIEQYGNFAEIKSVDGFSKALDEFYETRDSRERMRMKSQGLTKLLHNIRERLARKISKQQLELARCGEREQLRICGDLLQANLYRIERGAEFADVENFYDEQGRTLRIKLDPSISPAANAQKYYKDYQKAKNAEIALAEQIKNGREELEYIESVLDTVDRAETERELSQIRDELTDQGYLKPQKGKQRRQEKLAPLEFMSSDGFKIFVGRNNRQNDKLTLKTAAKNDMWLHTKDIHGSHVIIESGGRDISDTAVFEAARLAAYNSKARHSDKVPVDYTLVRYVSKPNGSKPGMVIYVNNKTIYVTPKESI